MWECQLFHILAVTWYCQSLAFLAILARVSWYLIVISLWLITMLTILFFLCLLAILMSCIVKCLFKVFTQFLFVLIIDYKNSLYILHTSLWIRISSRLWLAFSNAFWRSFKFCSSLICFLFPDLYFLSPIFKKKISSYGKSNKDFLCFLPEIL